MSNQSFFGLFSFHAVEHDAIDYGICYQMCELEEDITITDEEGVNWLNLPKGKRFHNVYLMLNRQTLEFINWETPTKHKEKVIVPIEDIAYYLCSRRSCRGR